MPMPSFFGGRRRAFPFDAMNPMMSQTEQKPDIPTGEVTARSGVRGLFTRKSLPNTLNVIGAGLRQMDGGNELDEYLSGQQDQQYRRDMFGLRAAQGKREDDETERTRQERLAALAALPPNLRPIAPLLTPEAISNAVMPPTPEYEFDASGRPYRMNGNTVEYGQGQIAVPQSASGAGSIPSGYERTPDGRGLQPIQGGPADIRVSAEGRARIAQLESSETQLQRAENAVTRAIPLVNAGTTGVIAGGVLRNFNQGATDLYETLEPVRSVLAFETLQEMRRNSQTGGALGSIAVRELELLASVYESLNTAQSEGAMRGALQRLQTQLRRSISAIRAAREEAAGGGQQAPGGDGVRVIELEPE